MSRLFWSVVSASILAAGCGRAASTPTTPSAAATTTSGAGFGASANSEAPPFNLEAILRGDGFGHVTFRQQKDPSANIVVLDVWVRDLQPNTAYRLQRAVDTELDGICTAANWLTLGSGLTPQAIVTDDAGTGRADLFRDLSAVAPGVAFDIHFRVIEDGTAHVALQSDCYRFVVRD